MMLFFTIKCLHVLIRLLSGLFRHFSFGQVQSGRNNRDSALPPLSLSRSYTDKRFKKAQFRLNIFQISTLRTTEGECDVAVRIAPIPECPCLKKDGIKSTGVHIEWLRKAE